MNRDPVDDAKNIATGILMTLMALRSQPRDKVSDETYAELHDSIWADFSTSTGWTRDEIEREFATDVVG